MPITPEEARRTAADAWIWGRPLLDNYRTMYAQAIDSDDPRYVGGFGRFRHYSEPFGPANWLPAPDGPFDLVVRLYGPEPSVLDGSWRLPPLTVAG
ncbi:hypothetical protein ACFTWS_11065 [Streptomyces sp. NPDC057027]|uniref:hypothetical protein n=1 Tax=Streptomyces sp. NPDC057027 TaxID=3346004 RepID=UPI003627C58B